VRTEGITRTISSRTRASCCICAVCAGLVGKATLPILSDPWDCFGYRPRGICREHHFETTLLDDSPHTEVGTPTLHRRPTVSATVSGDSTGTNFQYLGLGGALSR